MRISTIYVLLAVGSFVNGGEVASEDIGPSVNLVFCELGGMRTYTARQIGELNSSVLVERLRTYDLELKWSAFLAPMAGSYRLVIVPRYQGYKLSDFDRDRIVKDVEAFLAAPAAAQTAAAEQKASVMVEGLNAPDRIIGKLVLPLGTILTIEGEIVDGTKLRMKSLEGVALLQISTVNGQKLPEPCAFRFDWLAAADVKKLKGRVKLVGFETGQFVGLPADAFSHIDAVASEAFHFESSFVVLKSL